MKIPFKSVLEIKRPLQNVFVIQLGVEGTNNRFVFLVNCTVCLITNTLTSSEEFVFEMPSSTNFKIGAV